MYATRFLPAFLVAVSVHVVLCSNPNINFNNIIISVSDDSITCSAPWHYANVDGKCKCASETNLSKCTDEGTLLQGRL